MGFMFFITIKWQLDRRDIYSAIFITLTYNHSMDIGGLVAITFALIVSLMKERFRRINQFLKCLEYPSNYKGTGSSLFDSLVPSYIVVQPWKDSRFRLLGIVKQSHLELCKTSRDLTKSFGIQMSIETARTVIVFTALCFQLYNKVKSFNATFSSRLNDTLVTALLCVSHVFKIFLVNLTCTLTKREGQQTAEILHRVNSLDMDYEMKEEIHQFSLQMTQIPLEFSAYGFFCLDCSFLCGVFSTVATYLMILIQMGDQDGTNKITHK
ncbi:gustatory receptor for bitter taste 66a-like [Prorops nasuta]|uniref:gustatory receptor for bitter taste 66a-like n=1 Tax=Prorops nasuta TaxID=863751 RepID=UPI0034CF846E